MKKVWSDIKVVELNVEMTLGGQPDSTLESSLANYGTVLKDGTILDHVVTISGKLNSQRQMIEDFNTQFASASKS